jgi:peptide chain release factor subunit 1
MDLHPLIDRLAEYEASDHPFVSVYLDARPDQVGREKFHAFVRGELKARATTYPAHAPERASIEADAERILSWLEREARPQSNGIAIFACSAAGFFEAVQFEAPVEESEVYIGRGPHLYPLAALADRYRRHAAVVLDTHAARVFVFALADVVAESTLETETLPRSQAGGWSQARYQRHVEEFQRHHAREVVQALERLVREDHVERIVMAANDVARSLVRAELPSELAARVVEVDELDVR